MVGGDGGGGGKGGSDSDPSRLSSMILSLLSVVSSALLAANSPSLRTVLTSGGAEGIEPEDGGNEGGRLCGGSGIALIEAGLEISGETRDFPFLFLFNSRLCNANEGS